MTPGEKDLVEDLLKHDGFSVLEKMVELERERLINRLVSDLDVATTSKIRGEIQALSFISRETLEKQIRSTP